MAAPPVRLTTFLVKIASRCNLACDYCYMYEHADQSWRNQPAIMSEEVTPLLAWRIGEYVRQEDIQTICFVFHGGEPLLAGASRIVEIAQRVRDALPPQTTVHFSLQTNGTLLDAESIGLFLQNDILVSLSIDGGKKANDLHRLDHSGRSSFEKTLRGLELLEDYPKIYGGLISVIDPKVPPKELFDFFGPRKPPALDFLLPDANYERLPVNRDLDPDIYQHWLLDAFDIWFDKYSEIPVRIFDSILAACAGLPSETDVIGFGTPNLLTIETDGSYHGLDVLKITQNGATSLNLNLFHHTIFEAANSPKLLFYRDLLHFDGLAEVCRQCPEVNVCGGGAVPHRYSNSGLRNPTVYCLEMLSLIRHARKRMNNLLLVN